jgi:TolB-like protein
LSEEHGVVYLYSDGISDTTKDTKRLGLRFVGSWRKAGAETVIEDTLVGVMEKPPFVWVPTYDEEPIQRFTLSDADGGARLIAKDGVPIPNAAQPLWSERPIPK